MKRQASSFFSSLSLATFIFMYVSPLAAMEEEERPHVHLSIKNNNIKIDVTSRLFTQAVVTALNELMASNAYNQNQSYLLQLFSYFKNRFTAQDLLALFTHAIEYNYAQLVRAILNHRTSLTDKENAEFNRYLLGSVNEIIKDRQKIKALKQILHFFREFGIVLDKEQLKKALNTRKKKVLLTDHNKFKSTINKHFEKSKKENQQKPNKALPPVQSASSSEQTIELSLAFLKNNISSKVLATVLSAFFLQIAQSSKKA